MTAGSTLWQTVFISFAVVLLLLEIIRGYRLGLPRQLMRGAAVIAAYAAGYFGGPLMLPLLRPILKWPDFIVSIIGGALLAIVVYGVIATLGSLLFKRTAQHSSASVRLIYGFSGAFTGIVFGLFFIWLIRRRAGPGAAADRKKFRSACARRETLPARKLRRRFGDRFSGPAQEFRRAGETGRRR
jgi:hypothetical protein